jgi:PncC family amidohydrolase
MSTGPFSESSDEITARLESPVISSTMALAESSIASARAVGAALKRCAATVATAESCTGGLLSAFLTDVPGSSAYFDGGVVSYANRIKEDLLGVKTATLIAHGAVSVACVTEMACGVRERLGTTFGVAVSGIAGPAGGSAEKPVGTVHLAVASPTGCVTEEYVFPGNRDQIRSASVLAALRLLERTVAATATAINTNLTSHTPEESR